MSTTQGLNKRKKKKKKNTCYALTNIKEPTRAQRTMTFLSKLQMGTASNKKTAAYALVAQMCLYT